MQEERRMSSVKYQVHDETSQVSYNYLFKIWSWFVFSNQMDRPYVSCFQISCLRFVTYLERYFLYEFQFFFFLIFTKWGAKNVDEHASFLLIIICSNYWMMAILFILNCYSPVCTHCLQLLWASKESSRYLHFSSNYTFDKLAGNKYRILQTNIVPS